MSLNSPNSTFADFFKPKNVFQQRNPLQKTLAERESFYDQIQRKPPDLKCLQVYMRPIGQECVFNYTAEGSQYRWCSAKIILLQDMEDTYWIWLHSTGNKVLATDEAGSRLRVVQQCCANSFCASLLVKCCTVHLYLLKPTLIQGDQHQAPVLRVNVSLRKTEIIPSILPRLLK